MATSDDQGLLAQTTRTHDIELASRIDIRSEGGCLALQKLMSRDQIDHGAAASNPVDAVELALLGNCLFDQIVCVHIQFLSCLAAINDVGCVADSCFSQSDISRMRPCSWHLPPPGHRSNDRP